MIGSRTPKVAAILATMLYSAAASAQTIVDATDPSALLRIAQQYGEARLETDEYGDPIIIGAMGESNYAVEFYGCSNGRQCEELLFRAGFVTKDFTEREMAEWNRTSHFGKVYIDKEGDPSIEMDVILTGGVSETNMIDNFDLWAQAVGEFRRFIGWSK